MFAAFGTLLRLWKIAPMQAAAAISVLSLFALPLHGLLGGFGHMSFFGWRENFLQAILLRVLAGPAALYMCCQFGRYSRRGTCRSILFACATIRAASGMGGTWRGSQPTPIDRINDRVVWFPTNSERMI
jgi:hypothetical protein